MKAILDNLLALTKDKHAKLQQIFDMTRAQTMLLQDENVEGLEAQIAGKQQLMDRIDQLDVSVLELEKALQREYHLDLGNLDGLDVVKQIMELRVGIAENVQAAIEVDRHNTKLSHLLLEKLQQEMQQHQRANQAAQAYIRSNINGEVPAIYTNRKV